ncbi:hypothetical protein GCM10023322_06650 [Rugosimonospora acidiphila]|uniref:RNA ligase domain-containing protein n=1 Tax=Rugosimonospora acidiphila TaxID=556531 RepID=A0ABP9RJ86_9ACTN
MTTFDVRTTDLLALNSMTKYPSIPTYHALDPRDGGLLDECVAFAQPVIGTEKVDGTNARVLLLPDGSYLLGSREELLYARGDLIGNPSQGIVAAVKPLAEAVRSERDDTIRVLYLEVYGGRIGAAAKKYSTCGAVGWRLFDEARIDDYAEVLDWPAERISRWRDDGGQRFVDERQLNATASAASVELTPRLFTIEPTELPTEVAKTRAFLAEHLPHTRVALDDAAPGSSEGMVLRTADRSTIAKARFQDYDRTLRRRGR